MEHFLEIRASSQAGYEKGRRPASSRGGLNGFSFEGKIATFKILTNVTWKQLCSLVPTCERLKPGDKEEGRGKNNLSTAAPGAESQL